MQVTLLGAGCGRGCLDSQGMAAVMAADLIIGAPRVLDQLGNLPAKKLELYKSEEILNAILKSKEKHICVAFSGDSGFYSGCRKLVPLLKEQSVGYTILPGISSVQLLSARTGIPWQDWKLCSAHGTDVDILAEVMGGKPCFFLTGGTSTPDGLCRQLTDAGLGKCKVTVAENLGEAKEAILTGTAEEYAARQFAPLSVLLTEAVPVYEGNPTGIDDEEFIRDKVPMTKREVRALIPAALDLRKENLCWDIGAGTGSVSVELALKCKGVWAMEKDPAALRLIRANREKFHAWNLRISASPAPEGLEKFPVPDAVFIGGTGGHLEEIVDAALLKNPEVHICISAVTMETLTRAIPAMEQRGLMCEVVQLSSSRSKCVGEYHLLLGQNPTFLIYGKKKKA